jgi:HAD superfamily hydrolase (TIGR01509 family)
MPGPSLRPRAVLWDLDGTLADSSELHWQGWRDALATQNVSLTYEQFAASFGQRNDRFLRSWLGPGLSDERVARIADDKEARYRRRVESAGLQPLPGADRWVNALHAAGWRQAVASSAPRANVEVMLRVLGLASSFETFVGAEDVSAGKPDPQVFLAAAARLDVNPARCVVVEDAPVGFEAARRAGMRSIGVSAAARLDADVYVPSLDDLPADVFDQLVTR